MEVVFIVVFYLDYLNNLLLIQIILNNLKFSKKFNKEEN